MAEETTSVEETTQTQETQSTETETTTETQATEEQSPNQEAQTEETTKTEPAKFDKKTAEQVEDFLLSAGLDSKEVAQAVTENDGVTPEILAALVKEHGEAVANLIAEKLDGLNTSFKDSRQAEDNAIFDAMKDAFPDETDAPEKIWADLAGWAKTEESGITQGERDAINGMLQTGGETAGFAVKLLLDTFKGSEQFTQQPKLITGDGLSDEHGVKSISKQDYSMERRKLEKAGHREGSDELRKLDARRQKALSRGL